MKDKVINSKPSIAIDFSGSSGNIFAIVGLAGLEINEKDKYEMYSKVTKVKSYEEALNEVRKYVNIIEL